MAEQQKPKSRRGFAAMSAEKRREIARLGGASVPSEKRSFSQNAALAVEAGRKGGSRSHGGGRKASGERREQSNGESAGAAR